jgi:dynein heavy chain
MAGICENLAEVATVLDQFHKFLGPELRAVTGDSQGIDEVSARVEGLMQPLDNIAFDLFDRQYKASWDSVMNTFREKVEDIEGLTKGFIDSSFRKLRSAEGAFDLLQNFQNIQSRESINRQMMEKFDDILMQYSSEVELASKLFFENKENPPTYKNHPPVAGAIIWATALYHRVKKPIMRFRTMEGLLKRERGEAVKKQYLVLARAIDEFIKENFNRWRERVSRVAVDCLKQSILGPVIQQIPGQPYQLPATPYYVNFSPELQLVIRESKYLDRMGFHIPETALNVTLQEAKFHEYIQKLNIMLSRYEQVAQDLSDVEKLLLSRQLDSLKEELKHGFDPLNWNSLHITTFCDDCTTAINSFETTVSQVHKSSVMIDQVVDSIANENLISPAEFSKEDILGVVSFYDQLEKTRMSKLDTLVRTYDNIGALLVNVEVVVAETSTGHSPILKEYYRFWEKKFFNAITKMIITSMATFQSMLNVSIHGGSSKFKLPPLCKVKATMNVADIIINPTLSDIYRYLSKAVKHVVESSKRFLRWKDTTCIATEPVKANEDEEPIIFSFYNDIAQNPHVIKMMLTINQSIHKVFNIINKYLESWRRYETVYGLWDAKRKAALDKLKDRDPSCVYFDTRLASYLRLVDIIQSQQTTKDIDFLRVDCSPVAASIISRAYEWIASYGAILRDLSHSRLMTLNESFDGLKNDLDKDTVDLESLKFVLNVVADLDERALNVELQYKEVQERYSTLLQYDIDIDPLEMSLAVGTLGYFSSKQDAMDAYNKVADRYLSTGNECDIFRYGKEDTGDKPRKYGVTYNNSKNKWEAKIDYGIENKWLSLVQWGKTRDLRLIKVKDDFREVTRKDVMSFSTDLKDMLREFESSGPGQSSTSLPDGVELCNNYRKQVGESLRKREELVNAEKLFGLEFYSTTGYPELNSVNSQLTQLEKIYDQYSDHQGFVEEMSSMLFAQLDIEALEKGANEFVSATRKLPKALKELNVYRNLEEHVINFQESIPLILNLKDDALKDRHWKKLMEVTGVKFEMDPKKFTLENLFNMELNRFEEQIGEIVTEATKEAQIEGELRKIEDKWRNTKFDLARNKKGNEDKGYLLRSADEIKLDLEDNLLNLQTMGGSRYAMEYMDTIRGWERKLNHVSDTIDVWFKVQSKWMYLEKIFVGAEDIRQQLPEEAKKFDAIDKAWRSVMTSTSKNPNVVDACHADNRTELLNQLSDRLDATQKSLSDYLDTKRNAFPRFFFISDDELLSILGTSDPTAIQIHLLKMFSNCKAFKFSRGNKAVVGMTSSKGETFDFETPAPVDGNVEVWMKGVDDEMQATLRIITKQGVFTYANSNRNEWIDKNLGMVGLVGSQIWWTWETEDTFQQVLKGDKHAMKNYATKLTNMLTDLVSVVRQKITKHMRKKTCTMLIIDVHARDIIDKFVRDSILSKNEFAWESQLRFEWERSVDDVRILQCTGVLGYRYEFIGLEGRLVITPLTDRCYMTLTQALTFHLGGSPAGPAGTGKTETVKDLAKGLALPCFVINCGEGLDYKAMGSIFSGLAQIGAWGCFDEFNRINIEVLSVVSAQLFAIQNALNYGRATADIGLGKEIYVRKTVGIFITMNPGYAGRTELPDNLKALFRPVVMIVPDLRMICEIMLFSEGFEGARELAKKMTTLYKLAREQLSKQYHYDFGLRALKSVLVLAGSLKRENEGMPEDVVLMRALRDMNMPKFVFEDVPLFRGLISDLFPGLNCPRVAFPALKNAIVDNMTKNGYHHSDEKKFLSQVDKVIQCYETMQSRHTSMIVGPTGGGKTVCLRTLQSAMLPAFDLSVKIFTLNPKAQELSELYGLMDPVTRDWTDGILSKLFRDMNRPLPAGKENERRWLVYDGDVDALWIENMNSVMDDNRLLTLPNGERIRLETHSMMLMETFDLQYASPATISRCGMVWVDPKDLGFKPFYEKWVHSRCGDKRESECEALLEFFDRYLGKTVQYVCDAVIDGEIVKRLSMVIPMTKIGLIMQLSTMFDAALPPTQEYSTDVIEGMYMFAMTWSLGGTIVGNDREAFSEFMKNISQTSMPSGSLYEHFYDTESMRWEHWKTQVAEYVQPSPFKFSKILVPTSDSTLYSHILDLVMNVGKPVLFVGEPGTAKSVTIQHYLEHLPDDKNILLNINFSSRTSSRDVRQNVVDNVDKRTGKTYGPPAGKKLIVFIDDMNMPVVDTYGTQQPIALLHFLVGRGCMYDQGKDLELRLYKDMHYVAAMGPPGGGRNPTDPRFVALFNVFNLTPPTPDVLVGIFSSIISSYTSTFSKEVVDASLKITEPTLKIYHQVQDRLPPTPSKFHYIFNLRDLSKVYEGMCSSVVDEVDTENKFLRLWRNEILRVIGDRLTCDEDIKIISDIIKENLSASFPSSVDYVMQDPILFGDFKHAAARLAEDAEDAMLYSDLGDYKNIRRIFDEVLENHNLERKPMTLVLFEMALEHLTRIHRIIKLPRGNAMLVGVGGSGKQSLTMLATYCAGYEIFGIKLSRGYGEEQFREDLKVLYNMVAKGPVTFLFTDAHVAEESFLENVNNILTTGMVPALFEQDEKDTIANTVREEVKAAGIMDTNSNCWKFFLNKARDNLHVVLAMSPSGETLRIRCRNFPGLVSNTTIDWFFAWPEEALQKVSEYFLLEDKNVPDEHRPAIVNHMVSVHLSVMKYAIRFKEELRRNYYVTPKNYLDYIENYRTQMQGNSKKITNDINRLGGGLTKLEEAQVAVDKMSIELEAAKKIVDAKTIDCESMIKDISEKSAIANEQQAAAGIKKVELEEQGAIITVEKAKADTALESALPALAQAADALNNLNKSDITEIKNFTNPPEAVRQVCMCVLLLKPLPKLDEKEGWKGCKVMLNNMGFLDSLKNYNKDKMNDKMIKKVKHYFKDPTFTVEIVTKKSTAGGGLLQWVAAVVGYYAVAVNVEPLKAKVRDMEKTQAKGEAELASISKLLVKLNGELEVLGSEFEKANTELTTLRDQAQLMEKRLTAASQLITGLSGERVRWGADKEILIGKKERVVGDSLLNASFLSYLGAFTSQYRSELLNKLWFPDVMERKIPTSDPWDVQEQLTTDATIQIWGGEGLPSDSHSVQNGILTTKASRFPLCIDPQQQAVTWIKNREGDKNLTVRTFNDGDFMKHLELAIQFGNPFLFEAVDEYLDPMVDPILEKNTFIQGTQKVIQLGDKAVEWDDNFRLYMTSKLANPHYSPEVMGKTMIVNYSVTLLGLADQLLNVVVGHERPDLETQFKELVESMGSNVAKQVQLEDNLLRELANSTGNILDNEELIATLADTKDKSSAVKAILDEASFKKTEISKTRASYMPVATRGSILFFAVSGLSNIMTMYETSLGSFSRVFNSALDNAKRDVIFANRLENMSDQITRQIYDYTCMGIFERHKLMFSFQMSCMIMDGFNELNRSELDFFLKGDSSLDSAASPNPFSWMLDSCWKDLLKLTSVVESLANIADDVKKNESEFKKWYDLEAPETEPLPCGYDETCDAFQILLLTRCLRPDRAYQAVALFVMGRMGEKYVQPPVLDYARLFTQSNPYTPMVFILSPGADPASSIQALGEKEGFTGNHFKTLALGQGQGPLALQYLEAGSNRGHWVLLQNCHLLASWLPTLEKVLEQMQKPHENFRLWLTTDPTDKFPLGILQRSLKIVIEPPDGLKQNMRATFSKVTEEVFHDSEHSAFRPLVYVLAYVHAVLQERRKYGKIGWNVNYDFNDSDYIISRRLIALYLNKAIENSDDVIPWGSLKYLIGDAMYGGRCSDDWDRRVLVTYINEYMGDFNFDDCQHFYFSRSGFDYDLPEDGPLSNYTDKIETLPLSNGPAVFGLHPNAEIGYFTQASKDLWRNMIELQPRTGGGGGGISRDDHIKSVATDVQGKLAEAVDLLVVRKELGTPSPTQIVLLQELERWNALCSRMAVSLDNLQKALTGEIGMSDALDTLGDSLFNGFLPAMWAHLAPWSDKPLGSWMLHYLKRGGQYTEWLEVEEPAVIWLSGFHIPESYLTALVQTTCRKRGWPLDKSVMYTKVTKMTRSEQVTEKLESGTYVEGLYLEGASWDLEKSHLVRQEPKVLVTQIPLLQVIPTEASNLKLTNTFETPVYVTQQRKNAMGEGYVFSADLSTDLHESFWILQGVAMCLNIDT